MDYHDIFHLDQSIGLFKIDELMENLRSNGMWINSVDERGDSPVHIAAKHKKVDLVCRMLPHFHRVNLLNDQGNTALHLIIENCMSHKKSIDNHHQSSSPASKSLSFNVLRALQASSRLSTYFNKKHRLIRALISKGSDLNVRNRQGMTPLHLAAKYCYIDVLRTIRSHSRADFATRTPNGETLLHLVCKYMSLSLKDTPAEIEIMEYLVWHTNADVNANDKDGYTPLHYAVWSCSLKGVERMVKLGADLYSRTRERQLTPLHLAAIVSPASVVQFLVSFGADVNVRDASGKTPLHLVSLRSCRNDAMELLLSLGATVDLLDHKGCLPLDYVLENQNVDGLECLLEYGADIIDTTSLQRIPVSKIMNGKSLQIHVLKHLTRLKAAELAVCRDYEAYLARECFETYKRTCLIEVSKLKNFTIDPRQDVTLYDLLHMKSNKLQYAFVQSILDELRSDFPNYCGVLKASIHEVIKRKSLLQLAKIAFVQLVERRLTARIAECILDYLNDGQLIVVIESMESR